MVEKIKLTGGPEKTVTWIWMENGQLKVEFYDFSDPVQTMFGNDVAYTLTVNEMTKFYLLVNQDESSLIPWIIRTFKSYFGIKEWLEKNEIRFQKEVDPWA